MSKDKNFASIAAKILLDTEAVIFRPDDPFCLTSGKKSPVYVDCRKLISFPDERNQLMQMGKEKLKEFNFDVVAGGETAGIPYAAWVSQNLDLPMAYIRKKPKGFGRCSRIEGVINENDNVLLVEDMTTDGGSKVSFVNGIKDAGAKCSYCFVVFSYGIFPEKIKQLKEDGLEIIYLADWWDLLYYIKDTNYLPQPQIEKLEQFLNDPESWNNNGE